jgi:UDP-N-acetyl-2-amino-2-deoxyglucuronate dehydrogenase
MRAIKDNNCDLLAAVDPFDSVGVIDSYFPNASFFTEVERFDRHIDKLKRTNEKIDFFSICTPNYLHDSHIRLALRNNCDAICEKPLVIRPKNLKYLKTLEQETGRKIYSILQLRHHSDILCVREKYKNSKEKIDIKLKYITSRGKWYHHSWKGDHKKSGGIAVNIGIHFFDMLSWIFGDPINSFVDISSDSTISGVLELERATVEWLLSIDESLLPDATVLAGQRAFRSIAIDGDEIEFSGGFADLHTKAYKEILSGNGFGIDDATCSLSIVNDILSNS